MKLHLIITKFGFLVQSKFDRYKLDLDSVDKINYASKTIYYKNGDRVMFISEARLLNGLYGYPIVSWEADYELPFEVIEYLESSKKMSRVEQAYI